MKKNNHIVIATTFRDFNGSLNDQIQLNFLDSLVSQSYKNFTLVVTIFREKNVEKVINSHPVNSAIFFSEIPQNKKFCLSDVFMNGLRVLADKPSAGLIWTTCDVIFETDFLEKLSRSLNDNDLALV